MKQTHRAIFFARKEKTMVKLGTLRTVLLVAVPLFLVVGLTACSVYPPELTAADQAIEKARQAGKAKECPAEFAAAEKVNAEAHSLCTLCTRDQAIAKANQARAMVEALCPPKAAEAR